MSNHIKIDNLAAQVQDDLRTKGNVKLNTDSRIHYESIKNKIAFYQHISSDNYDANLVGFQNFDKWQKGTLYTFVNDNKLYLALENYKDDNNTPPSNEWRNKNIKIFTSEQYIKETYAEKENGIIFAEDGEYSIEGDKNLRIPVNIPYFDKYGRNIEVSKEEPFSGIYKLKCRYGKNKFQFLFLIQEVYKLNNNNNTVYQLLYEFYDNYEEIYIYSRETGEDWKMISMTPSDNWIDTNIIQPFSVKGANNLYNDLNDKINNLDYNKENISNKSQNIDDSNDKYPTSGAVKKYVKEQIYYNKQISDSRYLTTSKTSGIMPKTDKAVEALAVDYKIHGNSMQDGVPSVESPLEIESVGDLVTDKADEHYGKYKVETKVYGKNLWNVSAGFTQTVNGITAVCSEDGNKITFNGSYTNTGEETTHIDFMFSEKQIKIEPNCNYTMSAKPLSGTVDSNAEYCSLVVSMGSDSETYPNHNATTNFSILRLTQTLSTGENTLLKQCRMYIGVRPGESVTFDNYTVQVQFEKGDVITEYAPFYESTISAYLDEPLRKIDDYADYIDYKNQKVVRTIFCYKFKGNEWWNVNNAGELTCHGVFMPNETFTLINGTLGYSTNGVFDGVSIFDTDYEHCMCYKEPVSGQIYFYPKILRTHLSDSTTPTRADFNRIYSEGTEFCCIRKELVEEPIDLPPLPLTYGTNNIVPNTNIQPSNVEVEYYIEHEKQDKWECIADIVADGNTNSFELTDLNLKSVKMYTLCPKTDARHIGNLSLRFSNLGDTLYIRSPGDFMHSSYTIDNIIDIKTKPFLDMIYSHGLYTASSTRTMSRILTQDQIPFDTNVGGITYLKLWTNDRTAFPTGSTIKIYGVKNDE